MGHAGAAVDPADRIATTQIEKLERAT